MDKLHAWCYKVLPLAYDDSLSYYEVLCKLTEKINEIIAAGGFTPEEIKELQDDIAALQASDTAQNAEIASIKTSISSLSSSVTSHTSEIDTLQSTVASQSSAIADIDGNIANIEADISEIQTDVSNLKNEISTDNLKLERVPIREGVTFSCNLANAPLDFESYPYFRITVDDSTTMQNSVLIIASGQNHENTILSWDLGVDLNLCSLTIAVDTTQNKSYLYVQSNYGLKTKTLNTIIYGTPPADMEFQTDAVYSDQWMFGDSYYGFDRSRIFGAFRELGVMPPCSLAFPGASSVGAYSWLVKMLKTNVPKVIVWSLGLNDATESATISQLASVKQICDNHHIRLIPCTLPPITNRTFNSYNAVVKTYPEYIDQAEAVAYSGTTELHSTFSTPDTILTTDGTTSVLEGYTTTDPIYIDSGASITYSLTGKTGMTLVGLFAENGTLLYSSVKGNTTDDSVYSGTLTPQVTSYVRFCYKTTESASATINYGTETQPRTFDALSSETIFPIQVGKRLSATGSIENAQNNISLAGPIYVSPGSTINYNFYGLAQLGAVAVYDSNGTYIESRSTVPDGPSVGSVVTVSGTYNFASGDAYVLIAWLNTAAGTAVANMPNGSSINIANTAITASKIVAKTGEVTDWTSNNSSVSANLPVKSGDHITYSASNYGQYPFIAAYNASATYLADKSIINTGANGTLTAISGDYTVPVGVDHVVISWNTNVDYTIALAPTSVTSEGPAWTPGMRAADNTHPTALGAMALAKEYLKHISVDVI